MYVEDGMSTAEIAKIFNTNRHLIHKRLNQWEISTERPHYNVNHDFFNIIDTEEKAYWLNMLATDGNVGRGRKARRLSMTLQLTDIDHLRKFLDDIESDHKIYIRETEVNGKIRRGATVEIYSAQLVNDLFRYGVVPVKSLILEPYYDISSYLEKHYWRGGIDGDGYLTLSKNLPRIGFSGSWWMCNAFRLWTQKFVVSTAQLVKRKSIFEFSLSGSKAIPIIKELYVGAEVYLDRKYELAMNYLEQWEQRSS
jgi:hypothetical protein